MIIPPLTPSRAQAISLAWRVLDPQNRGSVPYSKVRDAFDPRRHPNVANNRRTEEEQVTDFLETFEVHHNTFHDYKKSEQVSFREFEEFYKTLGASYMDDDGTFESMVRGVWGVKTEHVDPSKRDFAGGADGAVNSRQRYVKNNMKGTPFGTSQTDSSAAWKSSTRSTH